MRVLVVANWAASKSVIFGADLKGSPCFSVINLRITGHGRSSRAASPRCNVMIRLVDDASMSQTAKNLLNWGANRVLLNLSEGEEIFLSPL